MAKDKAMGGFPAINFIPDRERVHGGPPKVRLPLWIALGVAATILIVIMAIFLIPVLLAAPR
jgi:hypothetical protein